MGARPYRHIPVETDDAPADRARETGTFGSWLRRRKGLLFMIAYVAVMVGIFGAPGAVVAGITLFIFGVIVHRYRRRHPPTEYFRDEVDPTRPYDGLDR